MRYCSVGMTVHEVVGLCQDLGCSAYLTPSVPDNRLCVGVSTTRCMTYARLAGMAAKHAGDVTCTQLDAETFVVSLPLSDAHMTALACALLPVAADELRKVRLELRQQQARAGRAAGDAPHDRKRARCDRRSDDGGVGTAQAAAAMDGACSGTALCSGKERGAATSTVAGSAQVSSAFTVDDVHDADRRALLAYHGISETLVRGAFFAYTSSPKHNTVYKLRRMLKVVGCTYYPSNKGWRRPVALGKACGDEHVTDVLRKLRDLDVALSSFGNFFTAAQLRSLKQADLHANEDGTLVPKAAQHNEQGGRRADAVGQASDGRPSCVPLDFRGMQVGVWMTD